MFACLDSSKRPVQEVWGQQGKAPLPSLCIPSLGAWKARTERG